MQLLAEREKNRRLRGPICLEDDITDEIEIARYTGGTTNHEIFGKRLVFCRL